MPTIRSASDRDTLSRRIDQLMPEMRPQWGKLTAPRMLAHVCDACRLGLGEVVARPKNVPLLRMFPLKQIVIHRLPFPKNSPTAPELLAREPQAFDVEREQLKDVLVRLGHLNAPAMHPLFGMLTPDEWGVLAYRHTEHHLRQFGV